jgi:hypothetical protein
MSNTPSNTPPMLSAVLDRFSADDRAALESALLAREDAIADVLRLAGIQFGLYPQIVAKVLADAGLGTVPDPEVKTMIDQQYVALMESLAQAHRDHGGEAGV